LIDSILLANSSKVQNEINSWEEEIVSCTHTENLKQCKPLKLEEQCNMKFLYRNIKLIYNLFIISIK